MKYLLCILFLISSPAHAEMEADTATGVAIGIAVLTAAGIAAYQVVTSEIDDDDGD